MEKTKYYTSDNINEVSEQILKDISLQIKIRRKKINLNKTALFVLDMQNFFLDEFSHAYIPSASAIIKNIKYLIKLFEEINSPIIFTKHTNNFFNKGLMSEWWRDLIDNNYISSEIINELNLENISNSNLFIIEKHQYDAFYETNLETILKSYSIENLIITGVMTHLCCESTIRSAFVRSFRSYFPIDATATYNLNLHQASFLNLSHGFTTPILTKDIIL